MIFRNFSYRAAAIATILVSPVACREPHPAEMESSSRLPPKTRDSARGPRVNKAQPLSDFTKTALQQADIVVEVDQMTSEDLAELTPCSCVNNPCLTSSCPPKQSPTQLEDDSMFRMAQSQLWLTGLQATRDGKVLVRTEDETSSTTTAIPVSEFPLCRCCGGVPVQYTAQACR